MSEEYFPRGGGGTSNKKLGKRKKVDSTDQEKDLFKVTDEKSDGKKKRKTTQIKKTKKHEKKQSKQKIQEKNEPIAVEAKDKIVPKLTYETAPGSFILGVIREIQDYELIVNLPHDLIGIVKITSVSDDYTDLLRKLTQGDPSMVEDEQEVATLYSMFKVGQPVRCKVLDNPPAKTTKEENQRKLSLTVNPKEVNYDVQASSLITGMVLSGCVSSKEDHGYVIDLGIRGATAFLKNKHAIPYLQDTERNSLKIGQYLDCMVTNAGQNVGEKRIVNVAIEKKKIYKSSLELNSKLPMNCLTPGMVVDSIVEKVTPYGLQVKFLKYSGHIDRRHLDKSLKEYKAEQQFKAAILIIDPATKAVSLTQLSHLVTPDSMSDNLFDGVDIGTIVDEAEVLSVFKNGAVMMQLNDRLKGLCSKQHLSDKKVTDVHQMFKTGSKHKCRILYFNYADNVAIITLKESIINEAFLRCSDIKPGAVVECTVSDVMERGVKVKISRTIKGFIPIMHTADVPLRHPEKKIKIGNTLKCRVLTVEEDKRRIILTNKRSLVKSEFPVITDLEQCSKKLLMQGVVALVNDSGVLVVFYNNVKGWVNKHNLSTESVDDPAKLFYVGQIVQCKVIYVDVDQGKLNLTFKVSEDQKERNVTLKQKLPSDFQLGMISGCEIMKKTEKGFQVQLRPSGIMATLQKQHLSDHSGLNELLFNCYKVGDVLNEVVCFAKFGGHTVLVTNKLSVSNREHSGNAVKTLEDLKLDTILQGVIKSIQPYGLFVHINNNLTGLVPNKYACDRLVSDLTTVFSEGDSITAKVVDIDQEKGRFLLSTRMSDCYNKENDGGAGLDILHDYLQYYWKIIKETDIDSRLSSYNIGQLLSVKVSKVTDDQLVCDDHGVQCIVKSQSMKGVQCEKGDKVKAVVLYIDPVNKSLELSLDKGLVECVKNLSDTKYTKAKKGQSVASEVHLVKEDFILVALQGHAKGRLAFLPSKKLFNDVFEYRKYSVGQINTVVVKKVLDNGTIMASLKMDENENTSNQVEEITYGKINHNLKLGDVVDAVVHVVRNKQMDVKIDSVIGKVHCTEVVDDLEEGTNPITAFKKGQKVKVKIIGFKNVQSHRHLAITHKSFSKSEPECSLKPSRLKSTTTEDKDYGKAKAYSVGETVQGVIKTFSDKFLWLEVSPSVTGKMSVLNISNKLKVVKNPSEHYHSGCVYKATVIGHLNDNTLELSFLGDTKMKSHSVSIGEITAISEQRGLIVKLRDFYMGRVALTDISDEFVNNPQEKYSVGQFVKCYVIGLNKQQKSKCVLSLRKSRVKRNKSEEPTDREIRSIEDLDEEEILKGYITNCNKCGVFVNIGADVTGRVTYKKVYKAFVIKPEEVFTTGNVVSVKILKIDKGKNQIELSMLEGDTGVKFEVPEEHLRAGKRKVTELKDLDNEEDSSPSKKRRVSDEDSEDDIDSGVDSDSEKMSDEMDKPRLSLNTGFTWSDTFQLPQAGENGDFESSDSDDDVEADGGAGAKEKSKEKKQLSRKEKLEQLKKEEQLLFQKEKQLLDPDRPLQTASDFDRLVLQSPNSSMVWLRYMAFHLEATETEKARAIAERALQTISFREEQEKLNVWVAYMNLENMYGTPETLMSVFGRAVKHNDQLKVYTQLAAIYIQSEKYEEADGLYNTMVKKFSQIRDVWINFGLFYFKHYKKLEAGRKVMERSFKSLENKDHIEIISKFAQMEFKYGESERGKSMFENLLNTYPKRTDLWSVYIDMMTKIDLEETRELYERLIASNMPVKKIKFCFKKFLDFETKHGTEETINEVKRKAVEYVDNMVS